MSGTPRASMARNTRTFRAMKTIVTRGRRDVNNSPDAGGATATRGAPAASAQAGQASEGLGSSRPQRGQRGLLSEEVTRNCLGSRKAMRDLYRRQQTS